MFITKGEDEEDDNLVSRFPSETRPLTLKNDDNKIIAATLNQSAKSVLKQGACWIQRGFVPARQLVDNVVDVDSAARLYSLLAAQDDLTDKDPLEEMPAMALSSTSRRRFPALPINGFSASSADTVSRRDFGTSSRRLTIST